MSTIYLPQEIFQSIAEKTDAISLRKLALVSHLWGWPARRLNWKLIHLLPRYFNNTYQVVESNRDLAVLVKELIVLGEHLGGNASINITNHQLKEILAHLPNLASLSLQSLKILPHKTPEEIGFQLKFNLVHLTSFLYDLRVQDTAQHFLREMLSRSINLKNLDLIIHFMEPNYTPIINCSTLETLKISNYSQIDILDPTSSLLPLSSISSLKGLKYSQFLGINLSIGLLSLVLRNTSTLESLSLERSEAEVFPYYSFTKLFPIFKVLATLRIRPLMSLQDDLLQILPSTLKKLDTLVTVSQFKHLLHYPRLDLQLEDITLPSTACRDELFEPEDLDLDFFRFLPKETKIIRYDRLEHTQLAEVYLACESLSKDKNLKYLDVGVMNHERESEEEYKEYFDFNVFLDEFEVLFKEIKIDFTTFMLML